MTCSITRKTTDFDITILSIKILSLCTNVCCFRDFLKTFFVSYKCFCARIL